MFRNKKTLSFYISIQKLGTYLFALILGLFVWLGDINLAHMDINRANAFLGTSRTISLYHVHTKESITITFKRGGSYDREALKRLNWFLRDWRRNEQTRMDPLLFDLLWEVQNKVGSNSPIHVLSSYRAPETNSALRRRSRGVAKASQHILGKALDFYLPDASSENIRMLAIKMQKGGVGYYPSTRSRFIHLDVGSVRAWPRLSESQLTSLFPDGKTVHITSAGKPLRGYEIARAEILSRGGSILADGYFSSEDGGGGGRSSGGSKSLWSALFGGDEDEDAGEIVAPSSNQMASNASRSNATFFLEEQQRMRQASRPPAEDPQTKNEENVGFPLPQTADNLDLPEQVPIPPRRTLAFAEDLSVSENNPTSDNMSESYPIPPVRPVWDIVSSGTSDEESTFAPLPPSRPSVLAYVPEIALATGDVDPELLETAMLPPIRPQSLRQTSLISEEQPISETHDKVVETASAVSTVTPSEIIHETQTVQSQDNAVASARFATNELSQKSSMLSSEEPNNSTSPRDVRVGGFQANNRNKGREENSTASFSMQSVTRFVACAPAPIRGISVRMPAYRASLLLRNEPIFQGEMTK